MDYIIRPYEVTPVNKCANPDCENPTKVVKGKRRTYCSRACSIKGQQNVNKSFFEKKDWRTV